MKLGEPPRPHVGDVDVADATVGPLVNVSPIPLDPRAIAQHALVFERADDHAPALVLMADDRQLNFAVGCVDEQFVRRDVERERAAADRDDRVALAHVEPRLGER